MLLPTLQPYFWAIKAGAIALVLAACAGMILHYGNERAAKAKADEKVLWDADRAQWQSALDKQKAEASGMLAQAQAQVAAIRHNNDVLHAQQEKDYADHVAATAALSRQLAGRGLRFNVATAPAAGCGQGGGGAVSAAASAPGGPASAASVQLPGVLAGNLRQLTADADLLGDAYRRCLAAVNTGPAL